jgi:hypothetical protein
LLAIFHVWIGDCQHAGGGIKPGVVPQACSLETFLYNFYICGIFHIRGGFEVGLLLQKKFLDGPLVGEFVSIT